MRGRTHSIRIELKVHPVSDSAFSSSSPSIPSQDRKGPLQNQFTLVSLSVQTHEEAIKTLGENAHPGPYLRIYENEIMKGRTTKGEHQDLVNAMGYIEAEAAVLVTHSMLGPVLIAGTKRPPPGMSFETDMGMRLKVRRSSCDRDYLLTCGSVRFHLRTFLIVVLSSY
jgi:hypothetical protein